jgi:uncharacterized protein YrrD
MLSKADMLKGYRLDGHEGKIGKVKDFYFDDQHWAIRYLVAETGDWLARRQVLISPHALLAVKKELRLIAVDLTQAQIEGSPSLAGIVPGRAQLRESTRSAEQRDPPFRSAHDVRGHHVQAVDGEIGRVEDLIIDVEVWVIRYFIIHTRDWWPGRRILISPQWIERVNWSESNVFINLRRETIEQFPECNEKFLRVPEFEAGLHRRRDSRQ